MNAMAETTPRGAAESDETPPGAIRPSRANQWLYHGLWLAIPAAALALSFVLEVRDERQVIVPLANQPLPELCTFRRMFGIDCAGCGLTRSFISISHGDLIQSLRYNPAGLLLYAMAVFQLPWQSLQLWRLSQGQSELRPGWYANAVIFALGALLLIVWIIRVWGQILIPGMTGP